MADQSRSPENTESRKSQRKDKDEAMESQESPTKPAASPARGKRDPKRDQWGGRNPVLVMREACKKAGITFVEDPNHPIYNEGSSITFMGPNYHGSTSPSAKKDSLRDASSTNEASTEENRDD